MLHMKEDETIDTFTTKLTTLVNKAASLGHTMKDEELVRKLLNDVPDRSAKNHNHSTKSEASSKDYTTIESLRSLSYSFARSWSASKQIQAMSSNLTAPRSVYVGPTDDRAARENRRGLEKEGKGRQEWLDGRDSKIRKVRVKFSGMDEGLGALQMQVRELFNRIVRSRAETLDVLDQVNKITTPVPY
nr:zinc finger, CCHC-type [Tanacetum cinerariifolium]